MKSVVSTLIVVLVTVTSAPALNYVSTSCLVKTPQSAASGMAKQQPRVDLRGLRRKPRGRVRLVEPLALAFTRNALLQQRSRPSSFNPDEVAHHVNSLKAPDFNRKVLLGGQSKAFRNFVELTGASELKNVKLFRSRALDQAR
jgi:hypothetical protein